VAYATITREALKQHIDKRHLYLPQLGLGSAERADIAMTLLSMVELLDQIKE
jgi:hypothetical protein